ncbi:MAG: hypothetical protein O4965_13640, partial [Trichodesmium sp. St19_bin1]|nr:hypothetical protein [Trichodesmium sp. St19_bin1]
ILHIFNIFYSSIQFFLIIVISNYIGKLFLLILSFSKEYLFQSKLKKLYKLAIAKIPASFPK